MPIILKNIGKSPLFDKERKIVREEAREEAREEIIEKIVINGRVKFGFTTRQIADFVKRQIEYVERVLKIHGL